MKLQFSPETGIPRTPLLDKKVQPHRIWMEIANFEPSGSGLEKY